MFQLWRWMFACTVVVALMGSTCFFLRLPNLVLATVGGHILFIGPLMLLIIHKLDVIGETKGLGDLLVRMHVQLDAKILISHSFPHVFVGS